MLKKCYNANVINKVKAIKMGFLNGSKFDLFRKHKKNIRGDAY